MAGNYGDYVAKTVKQGQVALVTTEFRPLVANTTVANGDTTGLTPMKDRRHVRYQVKGAPGNTLALAYASKNADGTYTTPTDAVSNCTQVAGNSTLVEPISDTVQVFGKLANKAGESTASVRVVVTEMS